MENAVGGVDVGLNELARRHCCLAFIRGDNFDSCAIQGCDYERVINRGMASRYNRHYG
jgi:hypothetical protein